MFAEICGVSSAPNGFILDQSADGLISTLDTISADIASARPLPEAASIAGHSGHILYLLHDFAAHERGEIPTADWPGSWSHQVVDQAAWQQLRSELRTAVEQIITTLHIREEWPQPAVGASLMLLTHLVYHLGEIRQRMAWLNHEQ